MRQADRLIREHQNGMLGKEEACLLTADDFEMIGLKRNRRSGRSDFVPGEQHKKSAKKLNQRLSAENESM